MPDDDQQLVRDRDDRFLFRDGTAEPTEPPDQPPVERAQVPLGPHRSPGALHQHRLQMLVAFATLPTMSPPRSLVVTRTQPGRRSPSMSASTIARADWVVRLDATESILIPASCNTFPNLDSSEVRDSTSLRRYRSTSRAALTCTGGMNDPRNNPHSSNCTSHCASDRSVLNRPGFGRDSLLGSGDQTGQVAQLVQGLELGRWPIATGLV